jgi:hypothetical protein
MRATGKRRIGMHIRAPAHGQKIGTPRSGKRAKRKKKNKCRKMEHVRVEGTTAPCKAAPKAREVAKGKGFLPGSPAGVLV